MIYCYLCIANYFLSSMRDYLCCIFFIVLVALGSCTSQEINKAMDSAEELMNSRPDSALAILNDIPSSSLHGDKAKARYALLKSMALDKNYVDTTTFDVLQPAIDYYLKKGTPNDKLRTYYYQARIYQNRGDMDSAIDAFIRAADNSKGCKDSLCLARTFVALATLYYDLYDLESYVQYHLQAANIYKKFSDKHYEFKSLANALNGTILLDKTNVSDSLIKVIETIDSLSDMERRYLHGRILTHKKLTGSESEVKELFDLYEKELSTDVDGMLDLGSACNRIGYHNRALQLLRDIDNTGVKYDTLKYLTIAIYSYQGVGDYKNALNNLWDFSNRMDAIDQLKFEQKRKTIEEKHNLQLEAQYHEQKRIKVLWGSIGGFTLLVLVIIILIQIARSNKVKKDLALELTKNKEIENEKLKAEREKLVYENKNIQLEKDKKAWEAESLKHRIEILDRECETLKDTLKEKEIPQNAIEVIRQRVEMLNNLLASNISNNAKYERSYDKWIEEYTKNKEEFMDANRLAFKASHPKFIKYFEDKGLTDQEINYICLYAIGLKGKEIGAYLNSSRHYIMSSKIRKKLNLGEHEMNLGLYVREILKPQKG